MELSALNQLEFGCLFFNPRLRQDMILRHNPSISGLNITSSNMVYLYTPLTTVRTQTTSNFAAESTHSPPNPDFQLDLRQLSVFFSYEKWLFLRGFRVSLTPSQFLNLCGVGAVRTRPWIGLPTPFPPARSMCCLAPVSHLDLQRYVQIDRLKFVIISTCHSLRSSSAPRQYSSSIR